MSFVLLILFTSSCENDNKSVYIYDNETNNTIAYFKPMEISARTEMLNTQTKEFIGYFDRKKAGLKTYIIRKDGGDILYFTESSRKGSIVYIFNPKSYIWGYFYQY